jgi:hypothetical protein
MPMVLRNTAYPRAIFSTYENKKRVGLKKEKRFTQQWHDLDDLFGKWSEEEFARIQKKITSERQIDEEIWK